MGISRRSPVADGDIPGERRRREHLSRRDAAAGGPTAEEELPAHLTPVAARLREAVARRQDPDDHPHPRPAAGPEHSTEDRFGAAGDRTDPARHRLAARLPAREPSDRSTAHRPLDGGRPTRLWHPKHSDTPGPERRLRERNRDALAVAADRPDVRGPDADGRAVDDAEERVRPHDSAAAPAGVTREVDLRDAVGDDADRHRRSSDHEDVRSDPDAPRLVEAEAVVGRHDERRLHARPQLGERRTRQHLPGGRSARHDPQAQRRAAAEPVQRERRSAALRTDQPAKLGAARESDPRTRLAFERAPLHPRRGLAGLACQPRREVAEGACERDGNEGDRCAEREHEHRPSPATRDTGTPLDIAPVGTRPRRRYERVQLAGEQRLDVDHRSTSFSESRNARCAALSVAETVPTSIRSAAAMPR
jgi:hypothetical protein